MDCPDYTTEHQKGKHLTYEEYVKIQVRLQDGWTANRIAVKELHCSPNTVRIYHGYKRPLARSFRATVTIK